ncbi:MAG: Trm112 family protein [Terrimicrobiaceae bacterium]|jgi:uncharacterized protein YbaR (Trm112 family)
MIDSEFLSLLCCPMTRQELRAATEEELKSFDGVVSKALIREDGRVVYPVRNGIPMLVPEAAIFLAE